MSHVNLSMIFNQVKSYKFKIQSNNTNHEVNLLSQTKFNNNGISRIKRRTKHLFFLNIRQIKKTIASIMKLEVSDCAHHIILIKKLKLGEHVSFFSTHP